MTPRQIGLLILLSTLWGGVFVLVKYALNDFSAVDVAFFRSVIGALGLFVFLSIEGGEARAALGDILHRPRPALLLGALAIAAPFMLIALGELTVPSGLAGVLVAATPIFIALFAPVLDRSEKINRRQGVGLILGLLGVGLVVGAHAADTLAQFLGALALLGAAVGGALSSFLVKLKYKDKGVPASTTSFFALSVGALLTLPAALITAPHELPGARTVLAVIVLGLCCTALTFVLYYSLINEIGEQRASLSNYLAPVFALLYGVLLFDEAITVAAVTSLALIISGAEITARGSASSTDQARAKYRTHPPCILVLVVKCDRSGRDRLIPPWSLHRRPLGS